MSDRLEFDVVIVGAGPAGLSAAIRLKQLSLQHGHALSVCVLEKGSEVGAHILSGAVLETRALDELMPDWRERQAPITTPVISDSFYYLTAQSSWRLPTPPQMHNRNNYIISLANLCRWLGREAEALGVEIYPRFSVAQCLYSDDGDTVIGVETTPLGRDKQSQPTDRYEPGVQIMARHTLIGEGCRGSLAQQLMARHHLRDGIQPQTYGIGIKELWEIPLSQHRRGHVMHTIGWPLDQATYGGSFLYHMDNQQVVLGFVIGLDYTNPYLSPFDELQRFKHHPLMASIFKDGRRLSYGARALNEGGWQSIPQLSFKGGSLIGCAAGFLNVPKIKGIHTAMKSGMLAAEHIHDTLTSSTVTMTLKSLNDRVASSWIGDELKKVRNIRPGFKYGLWPGLINAALETYVWRGKSPWTLCHHADHQQLQVARTAVKITYPKPDGKLSFDKLSSVSLSNVNHSEHQPNHLTLKYTSIPITVNLALYDGPEQRYCPAGVYEYLQDALQKPYLQINAQNCVHCKTCDIKDPTQNIVWKTPEGGGGPNYPNM